MMQPICHASVPKTVAPKTNMTSPPAITHQTPISRPNSIIGVNVTVFTRIQIIFTIDSLVFDIIQKL
jgi:hypothetical protein